MAKKEDRIRVAISKAEDRVAELQSDSSDRKRNEVLGGAIDVITLIRELNKNFVVDEPDDPISSQHKSSQRAFCTITRE